MALKQKLEVTSTAFANLHYYSEWNGRVKVKRLEVGVRSRAEHTALASTGIVLRATAEEDVTGITPGLTPGVLDLVKVSTGLRSVTNGKNTVIELRTTVTSEDTRAVKLEVLLVGLDGDGHGLLGKSGHHSGVVVLLHVGVRLRGDVGVLGTLGLVTGTGLLGVTRGVWVVSLVTDTTVLGSPVEGIVHKTTVAAHVLSTALAVVAINEVLLGERLESTVLDLVGTLKGTGGGERPTGTALALVLHGGDGTLSGPIDGGGGVLKVGRGRVGELTVGLTGHKTELDEGAVLLNRKVGELVVTELVSLTLLVVGLDVVLVIGEVLEHLHEVHAVHGLDLVGLEPVEELLLVEGAVVHVGRHGGSLE